ncbi:MAG TPA: competence/damage-inducible protein A [bacterium]|nr:competence/damage-inducible protein A [bacterium]
MKAEVITAGTELLLGQKLDTNSYYLSGKLAEAGVDLYFRTTVGDNTGRLKAALSVAAQRADVIIITGGLGPTVDDITRQAVAEFAGKKLVLDAESEKKIRGYFSKRNAVMPESNISQAFAPEGAIIIPNECGTAPGFILELGTVIIAAMPGVPMEMRPMMESAVIPFITEKAGGKREAIAHKVIKIAGMGESVVDEKIRDIFESSKNPTIGILAHLSEVEVRITAKAGSVEEALKMTEPLKNEIYRRLGPNIYGEDADTLESKIGGFLKEKGLTVSTAESCTAGMIGARLTETEGSSSYYTGGINAYSNEVKTGVLGVDSKIMEKYGAVSAECAAAMAEKCAVLFKTDYAVAVTGIAGPGGGSTDKPVGLVYIGIRAGDKTETHRFLFSGARNAIRQRAAAAALFLIVKVLRGYRQGKGGIAGE